jgi:phosphoribosyl 1,2-cyclic phosphodiesterase
MAAESISNLRIRFYGTQGSGSVFPDLAERAAQRELLETELLQTVFHDLGRHADPDSGEIRFRIEELLGGPVSRKTLRAYRNRFESRVIRSYGGWTTCVGIETADGYDLVLDCGSGFRNCAKDLQTKWADRPKRELHIFGTHSHLDHTEGFDQAAVCFDPRNTLHIYGNRQFLKALDTNLGIFSKHVDEGIKGVQTPLFFSLMPTKFEACEIRDLESQPAEGGDRLTQRFHHLYEPIQLGQTRLTPIEVFHPAPCLAYRIERGGRVFVFCTDHELRHGGNPDDPLQKASIEAERRVVNNSMDVDLLYRDGQFLRAEYDGSKGVSSSAAVPRRDWGHSCIEDVQEMARQCRVRRTLIGHHDPNRDWSERNWIDEALQRSQNGECRIELACAETVIDL